MNSQLLMPFPQPQLSATFLGRPQRFLAEMSLSDGTLVVAYCPNPGSLNGCLRPGSQALLWDSCDPKRKRRYTWRAVHVDGVWVGTDTHLANRIVEQSILSHSIIGLRNFNDLQRETNVEGMRVDFLLTTGETRCVIEVKSSIVSECGSARFPDSITERGLKQLHALTDMVTAGYRVVLIYLVQREDVASFSITDAFHQGYATAFLDAVAAGVEVVALSVRVTPAGFEFPRALTVVID